MRDRPGSFAELLPDNFVRRPQRRRRLRPTKPVRAVFLLLRWHRPEKLNVRSGCGSERLSGSAFVPSLDLRLEPAYSLLR
jgi:hypothetical protein